ncbi:MAG: protease modulator HflK [Verrucomicrobia bacterium]|nr:protease modulator HflK [Verrucomicrobiota bacterium]
MNRSPHPPPPAPPPPPPVTSQDDASTQALSEALRSSFFIIKILMVALVLLFLGSGFFTVEPQEKAIILRFGKPVGDDESALLDAGAHWAFPYPIDEVVRIPIGEVQSVNSTIGWYYTTPALEAAHKEPFPDTTLNPLKDSYVLTGDGSIVHARATLRYRIAEPGLHYMFDFSDVAALLRNAVNNALHYAAVRSQVGITRDTTPFRETAARRLEELIAAQGLEVIVDQLAVEVRPPRQCQAEFERVDEAENKKTATLIEARKYRTETLSKAGAATNAMINTADAERKAMVEEVAAEAKRFTDLLPEYRKNPQLFMDLVHAQALEAIYTNFTEKVLVQERADGRSRELRLLLSREPPKAKIATVEEAHGN